jgi:hypothetical protein
MYSNTARDIWLYKCYFLGVFLETVSDKDNKSQETLAFGCKFEEA